MAYCRVSKPYIKLKNFNKKIGRLNNCIKFCNTNVIKHSRAANNPTKRTIG